jgi:uncharacterized protein (TIGR03437 family)
VVEIATPNFGSFLAANYSGFFSAGTQPAQMIPGSAFLWQLGTWNQGRMDDLRGVDTLAIIGNKGAWPSNTGTQNWSDGVVSVTSASLNFARDTSRTRILPYCHIDSASFAGSFINCTGSGIAMAPETWTAVQSFLANTSVWTTIGTTPATEVSTYGGVYVGVENAAGQYVNDVTQVQFGGTGLTQNPQYVLFYGDFLPAGQSVVRFTSSSLGDLQSTRTASPGTYTPFRVKVGPLISSVTPVLNGSALVVPSGGAITINGVGFGQQCSSCGVSAGAAALQISSWSDQAITAFLPTLPDGLVPLVVQSAAGSDAINIMTQAPGPVITKVVNAFGNSPVISPNTWLAVQGTNLAPHDRSWQNSDFVNGQMPTMLDGVSVTMNGKSAYLFYISTGQLNVLSPPDLALGPVQVQVTNNGIASATFIAQAQQYSLSFFVFDGTHVVARHLDGSLLAPASLYPGFSTPAKPGEEVMIIANGFGLRSGDLPALPLVKIGPNGAKVLFAGLVAPGGYQFNVVVPDATPDGDNAITATYNGLTTQSGAVIAVQH